MTDSNNPKSSGTSWHYILLWLIALVSLGINVFLVIQLYNFSQQAQQSVDQVQAISEILNAVESVELQSVEVPIVIDETLPISLTVPFEETFVVPINTTIPISTTVDINENISVPINDTVSLNRDATIFITVLGQSIPVDVPIRADVPLNMQTNIPIDMQVPIALDIPIDLLIEVPVSTEVPIDAEVPVQMDFPVVVPIEEMGFGVLLTQVQDGLRLLVELLNDQAGGSTPGTVPGN